MFKARHIAVIGTGNAALVAAISATESGAHVTMFDSAPESEMGGNSRFTLGGFRFGSPHQEAPLELFDHLSDDVVDIIRSRPYSVADYHETLMVLSGLQADRELCQTLATHSFTVLKWLKACGIEWSVDIWGIQPEQMWRSSPGNVYAKGRGKELVSTLHQKTSEIGVEVLYSHSLANLHLSSAGALEAISFSVDGRVIYKDFDHVIVACGGFEANASKRQTEMGEQWSRMKVRGTRHNTGGGIDALIRIGADRAGEWNNGHAVPIDATAPAFGTYELGETTRRCLFQYGITLNSLGERFLDEGADRKTFMYSTTGISVASQRDGVAYQIFDSRLATANFEREFYLGGTYFKELTWGALAARIGINSIALEDAIHRYNSAVVDDSRFNPSILDGSSTVGTSPPRSNFAARLITPPYYAFPVCGGITFTFGGIRIDTECRVLNTFGKAIPGVFAAGELTGGFFYRTYPANAGLMRGAVTGYLAGKNAASS